MVKKEQWNKAFERMLVEVNREEQGQDRRWDEAFQKLADQWNDVQGS